MKGKITISFQRRVIVCKKTSVFGKVYDITYDESVWEITYQTVIESEGFTSGAKVTHIHLEVWGIVAQVPFNILVFIQELRPDGIGILPCTVPRLRKYPDPVSGDASPFFIAFNVLLKEQIDSLILNDVDLTGTESIA
jgi:hypothetical protein